jgi:hypothetical protein
MNCKDCSNLSPGLIGSCQKKMIEHLQGNFSGEFCTEFSLKKYRTRDCPVCDTAIYDNECWNCGSRFRPRSRESYPA